MTQLVRCISKPYVVTAPACLTADQIRTALGSAQLEHITESAVWDVGDWKLRWHPNRSCRLSTSDGRTTDFSTCYSFEGLCSHLERQQSDARFAPFFAELASRLVQVQNTAGETLGYVRHRD